MGPNRAVDPFEGLPRRWKQLNKGCAAIPKVSDSADQAGIDALSRDALTRHRAAAFRWGYGHYVLFAAVAAAGAGIQAQLHLAHNAHGDGHLVAAAALAVPVAISLTAIAWLQQTATGEVGDAAWLYLAAGTTTLTLLLAGSLAVAAVDALIALIVVGLVIRDLLARERLHNTIGA